jgi:hypothetical protein
MTAGFLAAIGRIVISFVLVSAFKHNETSRRAWRVFGVCVRYAGEPMQDDSNAPPARPSAALPDDRLDSWKEIAAYLGRGIRTVQRWEREEGLPVHRLVYAKRGSIYARREELSAWWESRSTCREPRQSPHQIRSFSCSAISVWIMDLE